MPVCIECGYDLRGLDLPHRCPECGRLADEQAAGDEVHAWYASSDALLLCAPPPCFMAYLHDPCCQCTARRRLYLSLVLPFFVLAAMTIALNCIEVTHTCSVRFTWDGDGADTLPHRALWARRPFAQSASYRSAPCPHPSSVGGVGLAAPDICVQAGLFISFFPIRAFLALALAGLTARLAMNRANTRGVLMLSEEAMEPALGLMAAPLLLSYVVGLIAVLAQAVAEWQFLGANALIERGQSAASAISVLMLVGGGAVAQYRVVRGCNPPGYGPGVLEGIVTAGAWGLGACFVLGVPYLLLMPSWF